MAYPDDFIPEIWATLLTDTLDNALVLGNLVNRNYQGLIQRAGDVVHVQNPSNLTVNTYSGTVTYEGPASSTTTITINQDKYVAFEVDDLDQVQSNVDLISTYTDRAAFGLADDIDTYIGTLYASAGIAAITWDVGTTDAWTVATTAMENLDAQNVPRTGRWMAVRPKGLSAILRNTNFIHASALGDQVLQTGVLGSIAGMNIVMSNNLANTSGNYYKYLYGHSMAISLAVQMVGQPEAVRRDAAFDTGVRARIAYGASVVVANALGDITADET